MTTAKYLQNLISFFIAHFESCENKEELTREDIEKVRWMATDLAQKAEEALKEMK